MIRYAKGPAPRQLTTLAATPRMDWDGLGAGDRAPIRAALVRDQGWLCAYCQRRITPEEDVQTGRSQMKIEHWLPRNPSGSDAGWGAASQLRRGRREALDEIRRRLESSGFATGELKRIAHQYEISPGTRMPEYSESIRYYVLKKLRSRGEMT